MTHPDQNQSTNAPAGSRPHENPFAVREQIDEVLRLDLVGPGPDSELAEELLPARTRPSNWYLTGFLVPTDAPLEHRSDDQADDDFDADVSANVGPAEESAEDRMAAKKGFLPSSIGLSFLVPPETSELLAAVRWGEYSEEKAKPDTDGAARSPAGWRRTARVELVRLPTSANESRERFDVPNSHGLRLHLVARTLTGGSLPDGVSPRTRAVSVFLVNERTVSQDNRKPDTAYAFQAELAIRCDTRFVGHPDPRGLRSQEWDGRVADLHYADTPAFATGHGVSADWEIVNGDCREVRTAWIPRAEVEKTETVETPGVELSMEALGAAADGAEAGRLLRRLPAAYRAWIAGYRERLGEFSGQRADTAEELLRLAGLAASRIEGGIAVLEKDAEALEAFRMANQAVAMALRKRDGAKEPRWRTFQIAFVLLNLAGLADPHHADRNVADLLFFPTGGGKTEAYLGLAAFVMVLRRLRNSGAGGRAAAGVSVVMRYTLRLLTYDQLGRAAALVCALELLRERAPERYGEWPFEIGLWVGKAATPNSMGKIGDRDPNSARAKVIAFQRDPGGKPAPIPLPNCPWCGTRFQPASFLLLPNADRPSDLKVICLGPSCEFTRGRALPIVAVDEPLYRRLPAFLIATVDKFASLPWVGPSGALLGGAGRYDESGFFGGAEPRGGRPLPTPLPPPDLIVQDELHLISGPLGTMAGLYETAIDALCVRKVGDRTVRPKIVASTATANQAADQVQALFGRASTQAFPPPGPNRRDLFFARVRPATEVPARRYLGVAAPGRQAKPIMRRVLLSLMAAAQRAWVDAGGRDNPDNPADPYMTVLSYFNALRELGGARRIVEEEVQSGLTRYGFARYRRGQARPLLADRKRLSEVLELTSRVSTNQVAEARERLNLPFRDPRRVDCALATNMISVGLDIQRLGLMVVVGQPKTNAEYIQATSRIGRDEARPGLVVTLLNIHKPRDRSHYERFRHYHETFYRAVEPGSITPFSGRALDRGLAGALVTLARHAEPDMTPPDGAEQIADRGQSLMARLTEIFLQRVEEQPFEDEEELREHARSVQDRIRDLGDAWRRIHLDGAEIGVGLHYGPREARTKRWLLREMLETGLGPLEAKFRAGRSLRDVEPDVRLSLRTLDG